MNPILEKRLVALSNSGGADLIAGGKRGIEKESLRITPDGLISRADHPAALGSALTNRYITTDYSEALLEFVTDPQTSTWSVSQFLFDIHHFTYGALGEEMLWPLSMPCRLRSEEDIPIAKYGHSNVGRMKSIYREGLGNRYGRYMQAIAGIHFNYSVPEQFWPAWESIVGPSTQGDLRSEYYLGVVRNVRRLDWIILYLFGASPAICSSFLEGVAASLEVLDNDTCYGPHATSLRMSDLGYQNRNQARIVVSANSLDEYISDLQAAIAGPNADYVKMGIRRDGKYLQLNANHLQIENEYYSTIRPKRVAESGERPTAALRRGGIEYVELRALDISPFDPVGVSQSQQKFLEAFLLYCLITESGPIDDAEQQGIASNHLDIARRGREPGLKLTRGGESVTRDAWASEILAEMRGLCEMFDAGETGGYVAALDSAVAAVEDPECTPSAALLRDLNETQLDFADYGLQLANRYRDYFLENSSDFNAHRELLRREAAESLVRQREIEAADQLDFDEYLKLYYS